MKVVNFFKNSFTILGESAIFIVALSWLYNCHSDDCHEPLIAVLGSSLPLIVGLFLRVADWFKKSEIEKYCESLYKQFKDIHPPLVTGQVLKSIGTNYALAKSIPISDIYIDLPLQTLNQPPNTTAQKNAARISDLNFIKIFQRIKQFWGKKPKQKKETFFRYGIKIHANPISRSIISVNTISEVLDKGKKIIIVGDRGCGKSTLLTYLTYIYSYRFADPKNFKREKALQLPKIKWVPVIIRCRDLNRISTTNFSEILKQHLSTHLDSEQLNAFHEKIFSELNTGNVLLLIDGIDEIRDIDLRKQFCFNLNEFVQTYPKITVVITCIESIFQGINRCFDERFEVMRIAKLTLEHKKKFIQLWGQNVEERAESIENLQNALITSRNLEGLTNNIQALSLIVQLPNINSLLQVNFATILREVIKLLKDKSEIQLKEAININEVMTNLSEVAFFMSDHKKNALEESEIIKIVNANSQQAMVNSSYEPHPAHLLLSVFNKHMGILESGYQDTMIDSTGNEHTFYKFIHPTFQDFFRVQAMMKRFNKDDVLLQLGMPDEPEGIDIVSANGNPKPDGNASSISKLLFSELQPERAEEVLLTILYPQNHIGAERSRVRVIFAANLLAGAPSVSKDIAAKVINALLESVNPDIDGKGTTTKTPLDEAMYNLLHSPWGEAFEASLLETFISCIGDKRITIGSIISIEIIDNLTDLRSFSIEDFCALIENRTGKPETEQVLDRLKLMSFAFNQYKGKGTGYFDNPDTKKLYDVLLDFDNTSEAVQMASVWALGWILNARDNRFMPKVKLNEAHASILMEYLSHHANDSRGLYWAALCLSRCEPVQLQPDWIFEWANVADRNRPQSSLSRPILYKIKVIDKVANLLNHILSSGYHSLAKEGAVLTLGRLGHYPDETAAFFLRIFENSKYTEATRQEALNYLVQIKDKGVAKQIHSIYKSTFADKNEFKSNYTYLALLATGDIDVLKEIIFQEIDDLYATGSMHPAFFVLKTNKNQNGARELLQELKKSAIPEIRELAKIALTDFTGQSRAQVIQTVLTQLEGNESDSIASGGLANKTVCILLVRGENPDGGAIFAYVAVRADKLEDFMEAQKNGVFYPEDYGVIIESGEGEPSEEIRKKMEDEYGFDHTGMIDL